MSGTDFLICPDGFTVFCDCGTRFFLYVRSENKIFQHKSLFNLNGINPIFIRT